MFRIPMPRHVLLSAVFLIGVLLLDRGVGFTLGRLHESLHTGAQSGGINTALENRDKDVMFFGSSRSRVHFMPSLLEEETGLTGYNAGANGQGIAYHRMLERLMLERGCDSKLFILQVDPENLYQDEEPRSTVMAPFIDEDPVVRELVLKNSGMAAPIKALSHTWRYNSLVLPMLAHLVRPAHESPDGFRPHKGQLPADFLERRSPPEAVEPPPVSKSTLQLFADFIEDARKHEIQVVLVLGPRLQRASSEEPALEELKALAQREDVPFLMLDENEYPVFRDPTLYKDVAHLNAEGAEMLTQFLIDRLREEGVLASGQQAPPAE